MSRYQHAMPGIEYPEGTEFGVMVLGKWVIINKIQNGKMVKVNSMKEVFSKLKKDLRISK